MDYHKIREFIKERQDKIISDICEFVEIESPTYNEEASRKIADFLESKAKKLSCVSKIERIPKSQGTHLIIHAFGLGSKQILIVGHTDTVHNIGSKKRNPTRIEKNRIYGCGIFDMKANCILILEALRAIEKASENPPLPVTIFLSCDEERGSRTGKPIVEREASKAVSCLVCEPSANGKVKTGRKGTASYKIKAVGIPAHAGLEPERGASAILELAKQIEVIHQLNDKNGTSAVVCTIKGGSKPNIVPEEAKCSVDVRFTDTAIALEIDHKIRNLEPFDNRVKLEVTGGINRPPLVRDEKMVAFYEHARSLASQIGYDLGETQVGGASDGNFIAAMGVPVLDGLGVKGDGAHTLEEYICIDDIPDRTTLLSMLILQPFGL
ncbi:MAG: M20 family metallopeptidase [Pyrinomonadaceae bacterium]|nr:M20 family metallopeptidase [Pyrinomonadaceae bacterium]MCX7639940.1 M20 family metallopeptidase [Pyrinomonadaceae bacterium]MDW8304112.1 M20 family metallopeptidase [Acidobacteriota bacterium]